jgi:hypothetical protein
MAKEKKPKFMFLMETRCSKVTIERLRSKLGFEGLFMVDPIRRSGGLALLWRECRELEIFNYSWNHINVVAKAEDDSPLW